MAEFTSSMKPISFSVYGIDVQIQSGNENPCLQALEKDFHFFLDTPGQSKALAPRKSVFVGLSLEAKPDASLLPDQAASEVHSEYVVYESKGKGGQKVRWIDYHGRALLRTEEKKFHSTATLYCDDA